MQNLMIYAYTCVPFNSGRSDIALAQVGLGNPRNAQAHARSKFAMATLILSLARGDKGEMSHDIYCMPTACAHAIISITRMRYHVQLC